MLPKLETPSYEVTLPLSKKRIKYRPFLVKEQKNLLMAMESNESSTVHTTIKDILNNCTLTEGINLDTLPIIDVEYYFINLRAKSVGEVVNSRYRCNNEVDGKVCNNIMEVDVNLMDVKPTQENPAEPEIKLTNKIIVKMKYPEFGVVKDSLKYENVNEITFNMIANSIEYIYDGEQFYYAKETSKEELLDFIEQLSQTQFEKIEKFFANLPKMKKKIGMTCSRCGFIHNMEVEGLDGFFVF